MSYESLMTTIASLRERASQTQTALVGQINTINASKRYSNSARVEMSNEARNAAATELATLQKQEATAIDAERTRLLQQINGTVNTDPAGVISYRDAQDRAATLADSNSADDMMRRALTANDTVLATAVLGRSIEMGFTAAIDTYTARHPTIANTINDLAKVTDYQNNLNNQFSATLAYQVPGARAKTLGLST